MDALPEFTVEVLLSLLSLTLMEVILGIDNVIFISILTNRLPLEQQAKGRNVGMVLALGMRVALLFGVKWLIGLKGEAFSVFDHSFSTSQLIFIAGGLFLIYKSVTEIHGKLEGEEHENEGGKKISFSSAILQIVILDIVFSFDSILTAVGLVENIWIMVIAVVISLIIMISAAGAISKFINTHPTVKMLALSFLLMIGVLLIVEGFGGHVEKGYVYFSIFFALVVETLNLKMKKSSKPVELKNKKV